MDRRITLRHFYQKLTIPIVYNEIETTCSSHIIQRLKGAPSKWGELYEEKLESLHIGNIIEIINYGNENNMVVEVKGTYKCVGYIPGDIIFSVNIASSLTNISPLSRYLETTIVGLPFGLLVESAVKTKKGEEKKIKGGSANIIIDHMEIGYNLTYFAKLAIYPHFVSINANKCMEGEATNPLYASEEVTTRTILSDPFYDMSPIKKRYNRIVSDIRKITGTTKVSSTAKVMISGIEEMFDGKMREPKAVPTDKSNPVIEFLTVDDIKDKIKFITKEKVKYYTFAFVPSLPLVIVKKHFLRLVACISSNESITIPTEGQISNFISAVSNYYNMKEMEANSFNTIFDKINLTEGLGEIYSIVGKDLIAATGDT